MATTNTAVYLNAPKSYPLEVKIAPYTEPAAGEIVVKNAALAINPIDHLMQDPSPYPNTYPAIIGQDVAGTVHAVGQGVTRFKPGDRIAGHAVAMLSKKAANGAFQAYTVLPENMATTLPGSMSFEDAVVLPLATSTAACGMYQEEFLALQRPQPGGAPATGKTLLIWGGATSVGFAAIQLAKASGYETVVTASAKNHSLLKKLGATHTVDYNDPSVVDNILTVLKGKQLAGVLHFARGDGVWDAILQVLVKHQGGGFIATAVQREWSGLPDGVNAKFIFGLTLAYNDVGKALYEDFLPEALAKGGFTPAPAPIVVGKGLAEMQKAVDRRKNETVSAQKMIVVL